MTSTTRPDELESGDGDAVSCFGPSRLEWPEERTRRSTPLLRSSSRWMPAAAAVARAPVPRTPKWRTSVYADDAAPPFNAFFARARSCRRRNKPSKPYAVLRRVRGQLVRTTTICAWSLRSARMNPQHRIVSPPPMPCRCDMHRDSAAARVTLRIARSVRPIRYEGPETNESRPCVITWVLPRAGHIRPVFYRVSRRAVDKKFELSLLSRILRYPSHVMFHFSNFNKSITTLFFNTVACRIRKKLCHEQFTLGWKMYILYVYNRLQSIIMLYSIFMFIDSWLPTAYLSLIVVICLFENLVIYTISKYKMFVLLSW